MDRLRRPRRRQCSRMDIRMGMRTSPVAMTQPTMSISSPDPAQVRAVLVEEMQERERAATEMNRVDRPDRADALHAETLLVGATSSSVLICRGTPVTRYVTYVSRKRYRWLREFFNTGNRKSTVRP